MPIKKAKAVDPIFAIAADNWNNQVATLCKYGAHKSVQYLLRRILPVIGHYKVSEINKEVIQKYIVMLAATGIGSEYIRHHLTVIKGVMEYSDDDWEMPKRLKIPKRTKPKQEYYNFEEARKIINACSGMLKILCMTLAETGCRLGEALALQPGDVQNNIIRINKNVYEGVLQPTPKTESSEREVCISDKLMKALNTLKQPKPTSFLFRSPTGRPAWPQDITYVLKANCEKAGVKYKAFHAFRRGNITELLIKLNMPERVVGHRVGHLSTHSITLGVYCKTENGCDKPWVDKIAELLYGSE